MTSVPGNDFGSNRPKAHGGSSKFKVSRFKVGNRSPWVPMSSDENVEALKEAHKCDKAGKTGRF